MVLSSRSLSLQSNKCPTRVEASVATKDQVSLMALLRMWPCWGWWKWWPQYQRGCCWFLDKGLRDGYKWLVKSVITNYLELGTRFLLLNYIWNIFLHIWYDFFTFVWKIFEIQLKLRAPGSLRIWPGRQRRRRKGGRRWGMRITSFIDKDKK